MTTSSDPQASIDPPPAQSTVELAPGIVRLSEFQMGDMLLWYILDQAGQRVGLWMIPVQMRDQVVPRRSYLTSRAVKLLCKDGRIGPLRAWTVDSLVQVAARTTHNAVGRGQSRSLRRWGSTESLKYQQQQVQQSSGRTLIETTLASDDLQVVHELSHAGLDPFVRIQVRITNVSNQPIAIDMASSFSLGGITPFAPDEAPERLRLHRFRTAWAMEGRHVIDTLEQLHLDRTWAGFNQVCERFGHVGSRPVTTFFPQALVEDHGAGVFWGASLTCEGSWQIELYRQDDTVNLSGGLADREMGHWSKQLAPGQILHCPSATITTVAGDIDQACQRLTAAQKAPLTHQPAIEHDLPICFNDFCTFWGHPHHDRIVSLAQRLKDSGVTYYVIDEGWASADNGKSRVQGDWKPDPALFPHGLAATINAIRDHGLVPGIWYEWEVAMRPSRVFDEQSQYMVHRDGSPLTVGGRRFWDMRQKESWQQIDQRMIRLLRELKLGYLKIDYNENIGPGVDGSESPGEGLRQHVLATHQYIEHLRRELPDLVIENCASGGHRLEPRMQGLCAVGSFSDAHETDVIPVVAANLLRLILPRQSLVWATLRAEDDERRLVYSLASTFLGRMCLSGDVDQLSSDAWALTCKAMELYRQAVPIIRDSRIRRFGPPVGSYETVRGWQSVRMQACDGRTMLVVMHRFGEPSPQMLTTPLPHGTWQPIGQLLAEADRVSVEGDGVAFQAAQPWSACVVLLDKAE